MRRKLKSTEAKERQGLTKTQKHIHPLRNLNCLTASTDEGSEKNVSSLSKYVTSNSYHSGVFFKLYKMQEEGKLCDVRLQAKTGYVLAHRLVLTAVSPYFYENLQLDNTERETCKTLDLKHVPLNDLKKIICIIYIGEMEIKKTNVIKFSKFCQSLGLKTVFDESANKVKIEVEVISENAQKSVVVQGTDIKSTSDVIESHQMNIDSCNKDDTENNLNNNKNIKPDVDGQCISYMIDSPENDACLTERNKYINENSPYYLDNDMDSGKLDNDVHVVSKCTYSVHNDDNIKQESTPKSDDISCEKTINDTKNKKERDFNFKNKKCTVVNLCCKKCNKTFSTQSEKILHRKTCLDLRPRRRCCLCKISFATAEEYTQHRNTDMKCLQIRREKDMKQRQKKADLRARNPCRVCSRKFRQMADLTDHEFTAHDLPYDRDKWPDLICEWCTFKTISKWRLHHHTTYDCSRGNQHICDLCSNNYKNEKTLKLHKDMVHSDTIPMLPCDQCGKTLKGLKGLKYHIKIMHNGENPLKKYMCHVCSLKYTSTNDLTFHLHRVHGHPLPDRYVVYSCPKCDYSINRKGMYEKHILLHDDKRDFNCEKCDKTFKTSNSLHTHMKSHTGRKIPCPYEHCKYRALKKSHLKNHVENQHTKKGMKNENCHVCSYSTFFKGNLLKHLRSVHQLEVVTRYSVQMKAKYKNMQTGDIVGEAPAESGKQLNNADKCGDQSVHCVEIQKLSETGGQTESTFIQCSKPSIMIPHSQSTMIPQSQTTYVTDGTDNTYIASRLHSAKSGSSLMGSCSTVTVYDNYGAECLSSVDVRQPSVTQFLPSQVMSHPVINEPVYSRGVTEYERESSESKITPGVMCPGWFEQQSVDQDDSPGDKIITYTEI